MSIDSIVLHNEHPELTKLRRQDIAIAELAEKYLPLTINGIDDKAGYKAVHDARMVCVKTRTGLESTRKMLVADALEYQRTVNAEAKRITGLLEPIESHLTQQQKAIDDAKQKIVDDRLQALRNYGVEYKPDWAAKLTDKQFDAELANAKTQWEIREEAKRQAELEAERVAREQAEQRAREDAERKAEAERLRIERERLEAIAAEQRAAQAKIDAEKRELEAKRLAEQRAIELEQARKEAAERAIEAEKQRAAAAELKRIEAEKAAEAARIKAESERPYREKLLAFADMLDACLQSNPAGPCGPKVMQIVTTASKKVRELAEGEL